MTFMRPDPEILSFSAPAARPVYEKIGRETLIAGLNMRHFINRPASETFCKPFSSLISYVNNETHYRARKTPFRPMAGRTSGRWQPGLVPTGFASAAERPQTGALAVTYWPHDPVDGNGICHGIDGGFGLWF